LWDNDIRHAQLVRQVRLAREAGALGQLPVMLDTLGTAVAATGDLAAASALIVEVDAIRAVTAAHAVPLTPMMLAALRGRHSGAALLIETTVAEARAGGQGIAIAYAHWAVAIMHNGLGRYEEALAAARQASEDTTAPHISIWALPGAGRGRCPRRTDRTRTRCAQAAGGDYAAFGQRFRARHRGTLPGTSQP
jgi:hypothetical protein